MRQANGMRCYYVLAHGRLNWTNAGPHKDVFQPRGFFCHRYVLASNEKTATARAFLDVRAKLADTLGENVGVTLEAEEISPAAIWRCFTSNRGGHAFYERD